MVVYVFSDEIEGELCVVGGVYVVLVCVVVWCGEFFVKFCVILFGGEMMVMVDLGKLVGKGGCVMEFLFGCVLVL